MNPQQLLNEILPILHSVKEDKVKLEKILSFLQEEIYEEPAPEEVPEKYKVLVSRMAESVDCGLVCYFNPDTLEVEDVPQSLVEDPDEFEMMTGDDGEGWGLKHAEWENCITIEPLHPGESFRIMEGFTNQVSDNRIQLKLVNALNRKRPFANFRQVVDNSEFRQDWFDFKQAWLEEYVWREIELVMDDGEAGEDSF